MTSEQLAAADRMASAILLADTLAATKGSRVYAGEDPNLIDEELRMARFEAKDAAFAWKSMR